MAFVATASTQLTHAYALGMDTTSNTAVLFDFGGTLDADGLAWKERVYRLFREEGVAVERERFDPLFHAADDALVGTLSPTTSFDATVARSDRAALRRHERAIRLRGFRTFRSGLWLRPANLRIAIAQFRDELRVVQRQRRRLPGRHLWPAEPLALKPNWS